MTIIKAGMWDKVQYIFRNYYDRMMHTSITYNGMLDVDALKEAFTIMVTKVPILHSKYVANPIKPYWKVTNAVNADRFFNFIESDNAEAAADTFLCTSFPAQSDYQIRALLVRQNGRDILCTLINHMCFDGSDLKYFNQKLAECYNNIREKNLHTVDIKGGDRGELQVYDSMKEDDRRQAKKLYSNSSKIKQKVFFPYDNEGICDKKMIIRRKIIASLFEAVKVTGKAQGYTINDIMLAAYLRAFYKISGRSKDMHMAIPAMIDLRRHIKGGKTAGLTNLTGMIVCQVEGIGDNIFDTTSIVSQAIEKTKKDKYIGLYGPPLLRLAFKLFPNIVAENLIKIGYSNPLVGISNIGVIEEQPLIMGGVGIVDTYMTGATKFKPYIQLAFTTFRNEITMTVAVKCNNYDRKKIEQMLAYIEEELKFFGGTYGL